MNHLTKNRVLTLLVILLLLANAISITMFWLGKGKQIEQITHPPQPKGKPQDFLIKELKLDEEQQIKLEACSKEQREAVNDFREKIKEAKENFFNTIKKENPSDSAKKNAAAAISDITQQIDLLTLNYFEKVRAICNADQQKKFDKIIKQVIGMMSEQRSTGSPREALRIDQDGNEPPPPPVDDHADRPPARPE